MRITDTTEKITESKTPICQNGSGAAISAKIADKYLADFLNLTNTILNVYSIHQEREMKNDYDAYLARVQAKEYWKNRKGPTPTEMIRKADEEYIVIHHPNGLTERIRKQ